MNQICFDWQVFRQILYTVLDCLSLSCEHITWNLLGIAGCACNVSCSSHKVMALSYCSLATLKQENFKFSQSVQEFGPIVSQSIGFALWFKQAGRKSCQSANQGSKFLKIGNICHCWHCQKTLHVTCLYYGSNTIVLQENLLISCTYNLFLWFFVIRLKQDICGSTLW